MQENNSVVDSLDVFPDNYELQIKITGDDYSGKMDATLASIVVDIQSKIYQLAALGLYGDEHETRRLGPDMRRRLLLRFDVKPGCTEILTELVPSITELIKPVFDKMTPQDLIELAKFFALLFAGYKLSDKVISGVFEKINKSNRDSHEQKILSQQANALLIASGKLGEDASLNVAKITTGSTDVKFGTRHYGQKELESLRERAPRCKTSNKSAVKNFIVEKIDFKKRPVVYMELRQIPGDSIVKAQYTEDEQDSFYDDETTQKLCYAAASGDQILLDVIESYTSEGEIQKVVVINVHES